jgi:MYXO-CTERM domain-containing protein
VTTKRPLWLAAGLLLAPTALADVAPPPGYVERCTVEKQQKPNETCIACSTYHAEHDACAKQHAGRGFAHRCQTRGASVWTEVWCKPSSGVDVASTHAGPDASAVDAASPPMPSASASSTAPAPPLSTSQAPSGASSPAPVGSAAGVDHPPAPEKGGSCGACSVGSATQSRAGWGLGLLFAVALGRRRAQRPQSR